MWSHTIPSSTPKPTTPSKSRNVKATAPIRKGSTVDAQKEEMQSLDTDGSSRTSKVHPPKKPLTVAKAPTFGRTSSRAEQRPTEKEKKESPRPVLDTRRSRVAIGTAAPAGTPTKSSKTSGTVTPVRPPRTATPTQISKASKLSTQSQTRPVVKSSKTTTTSKDSIDIDTSQPAANAPASESSPLKAGLEQPADDVLETSREGDTKRHVDEKGESFPTPEKGDHDTNTAVMEEGPNNEVSKDESVPDQSSRDPQDLATPNAKEEHSKERSSSFGDWEKKARRVKQKLEEEAHREIAARDEIIANLRGEIKTLKTSQENHAEEGKSLASAELETVQKELGSAHRRLEDLENTHRTALQNHEKRLKSKEQELRDLSGSVQDLREKLGAADKDKEQEVSHSYVSLRDEFRDLQHKQKRKIEEVEAAASLRMEVLQRDHDELLQKKDQEIKGVQELNRNLEESIEKLNEIEEQNLRNASAEYERRLEQVTGKNERDISELKTKHQKEMESLRGLGEEKNKARELELLDVSERLRQDLQSATKERSELVTQHKQELDEVRMKHEGELEPLRIQIAASAKTESELSDTTGRIQLELDANRHAQQKQSSEHEQQVLDLKAELAQQREATREIEQRKETEREHELLDALSKSKHEMEALEKVLKEKDSTHGEYSIGVIKNLQGDLDSLKASHSILDAKHIEELRNAVIRHKEELESARIQHQKEMKDGAADHEDAFSASSQKHQEELEALASTHRWELQSTIADYEAIAQDTTQRNEQKLQQIAAEWQEKFKELNKTHELALGLANSKHEEKLVWLTNQHQHGREDMEQVHQLAIKAASVENERLLRDVVEKHRQEIVRLNHRYDELENMAQNDQQALHSTHEEHEREVLLLRNAHDAATGELAKLKLTMEELNKQHVELDKKALSKSEEDARQIVLKYERAIEDASHIQNELRTELQNHKQEFLAAAAKHGQEIEYLTVERKKTATEISHLLSSLEEKTVAREEAMVEIAMLKDKLELASIESQQDRSTIASMQEELIDKQTKSTRLAEEMEHQAKEATVEIALLREKSELSRAQGKHADADVQRERKEAAIEITLLKDKLELAELQDQHIKEDAECSRNEAAVETALLHDKLELAELRARQDETTIAGLQKEVQALQSKIGKVSTTSSGQSSSYIYRHLREEMAMLERHHMSNLADVAALKASMLSEREARESEWKKRAETRENLLREMGAVKLELAA